MCLPVFADGYRRGRALPKETFRGMKAGATLCRRVPTRFRADVIASKSWETITAYCREALDIIASVISNNRCVKTK